MKKECKTPGTGKDYDVSVKERTPGEQLDAYSAPSERNVKQAVKELNNIGPEQSTNNIDSNNR